MWYALLGIACIAVGIAAGYLWAAYQRSREEIPMSNKLFAILRDVVTGIQYETTGRADVQPTELVLEKAELDPQIRIQIPVRGLDDQAGGEDPVLDARFVSPATEIEVGVGVAFVPELFTQSGTAESYVGNETRWEFTTSNGAFVGNVLTATSAGTLTITAEHTGGLVATHPLTAFVDDELPPETEFYGVDFSLEANGTTLDEITAASGHTFVLKPNGATGEVQSGQFIALTGFPQARAVGVAPPAEYDLVFVIDVKSYESTRMQSGVWARLSDDFTQGYQFSYSARDNERQFVLDNATGTLYTPISRDLAIGQHQCRARVRNAFKALDLMVGGEWVEIGRLNDNAHVGGMPGIYASGTNTASTGVGLVSVEGLAPSADPEVDTAVYVFGVPAQAIEETDYQIHAQLRELDGTVVSDSLDSPGDWTHAVTIGAGQATIGGPNDDILQVGPLV